jgi:hypothetical protein
VLWGILHGRNYIKSYTVAQIQYSNWTPLKRSQKARRTKEHLKISYTNNPFLKRIPKSIFQRLAVDLEKNPTILLTETNPQIHLYPLSWRNGVESLVRGSFS